MGLDTHTNNDKFKMAKLGRLSVWVGGLVAKSPHVVSHNHENFLNSDENKQKIVESKKSK